MSTSKVVSGLMIAKRSTGSPRCELGTTKPICSSSSRPTRPGSRPSSSPRGGTRRPTAAGRARARARRARSISSAISRARVMPCSIDARYCVGAVGREREPQRQAARAPCELDREVGRIPIRTLGERVEVLGVLRVRRPALRGVAVDQRAASNGANSHLCGSTMTESAQLDTREGRSHPLHEHRGESVRPVDVQPDVAAVVTAATEAMSSTIPKFVVPPVDDHREDRVAVLVERRAHGIRRAVARRRPPARATTSTSMTDAADSIDECASALHTIFHADEVRAVPASRRFTSRGIPRGDQRRQVADRAALHEDPARALGQSELPGEPVQHLVLGEDSAGALEPRAAVDRGCRHDEVERDRRLARCARDERQVPGVVDRQAGRREHIREERRRTRGADAGGGDRAAPPSRRARPASRADRAGRSRRGRACARMRAR